MDRMRVRSGLWLLLSLLAAIIVWLYMNQVLLPWEQYFNVDAGTMKAALGDLYTPWYGTRALLVDRKNPYGPAVTHDIQIAFYGHDVVQNYELGVRAVDEQRFAYPVYVVLLLSPVAHAKFDTLQAVAPAVLIIAVLSSVWLWMSVLQWQPSVTMAWAIALFILASPQIAQGLRLRQLGFIVAGLLALATWLVARKNLLTAGAILALSTIKPQMVFLPLAWFVIWTIGDLRERWRLLAGFAGSWALLVGAGELVLPGWHRDFLAGLAAYRKYGPVTTLLQLALGNKAGMVLGGIVIAGLLVWGWMNREDAADSPEFVRSLSAFLVGAALALPLMSPFNQVLLILPVLIIVRDWSTQPLPGRAAFVGCVTWPWITALVLLVARPDLKSLRPIPLLPAVLVLFLPILLTILLAARRTQIATPAY